MNLTRTQIKRIEKSKRDGTGVDIKISLSQMRKQDGGNLLSALVPMLRTAAPAILKTVDLSGLSGLVSGGVEKAIKGSGEGRCSGKEKKVEKRRGSPAGSKQPLPKRPTLGRDSLMLRPQRGLDRRSERSVGPLHGPRFANNPLSSLDLLEWVERLGMRNFRGVFSRDGLPGAIRKRECGIINLDDQAGPGTHWVCYRNLGGDFCEYFDSFGLRMPHEVERYLAKSGKQLTYSGDEIQERDSVLCGYWCLYYLLERQNGRSVLDVIHDPRFGVQNQDANEFVRGYFGRT